MMHWIQKKIATRLGGPGFNEARGYKFNIIQQLKEAARQQHPSLPCLDLGVGEPDKGAHACVIKSLRIACNRRAYKGYANNGATFFKKAVADYMLKNFQVGLDASKEVLPVMGIKSGLALLAGTLTNSDDHVVCTVPGYPVFPTQVQYYGGQIISLPLLPENGFLPVFNSIPEKLRTSIKCCLLNYPNNPTGARATYSFFQEVIEWALRYRWIIIHDAAYASLNFDTPLSIFKIPGAKECAVELHSMSKGFNMTGWRLGWICGNATLVQACGYMKSNSDSGQFLPIQQAATTALQHSNEIVSENLLRYRRRIQALIPLLKQFGFEVYPPQGGFFIYVRAPKQIINRLGETVVTFSSAMDCTCWLLEKLNVVTVPWDEAGAFLRFSVTFEAFSLKQENIFFRHLKRRLMPYKAVY